LETGKPVILTFIGNYLPGFKSGGILRSIVNTVDSLCDEYDFWIVTRDRDLGEDQPYPDIKVNQWQRIGSAMVYYIQPPLFTLKEITKLINNTQHDIIFLNSFFETFTIDVLLIRKLGKINCNPVIVSPRGEFAWASLKLKYAKKFIFIQVARLTGLYKNVTWHASSEFEMADIMRVMKIKPEHIHIALDLPVKMIHDGSIPSADTINDETEGIRIVFLSRISREKNLDYAIKILQKVKTHVVFNIFGPAEDTLYWEECQVLIGQLPQNVTVNYQGSVAPEEVSAIFSGYDLFLFPSGGENYGHVIAESLTSGTPVLISDKTPWKNLEDDGLGWDIPLESPDAFVEIIENLARLNANERHNMKMLVKNNIRKRIYDPAILEANRTLFTKQFMNNPAVTVNSVDQTGKLKE